MTKKNHTNILILMEPHNLKDVLQFNIEAKLKIQLLDVHSEAEAVGLLVTETPVDIVILDVRKKWNNFIKYVLENNVNIQFIELYDDKTDVKSILPDQFNIIERIPISKLLELVPLALERTLASKDTKKYAIQVGNLATESDLVIQADSDFCRIKTNLLLETPLLQSDIFIRLSEQKYIRLFAKGDTFDKNDLEKYLNQKKIGYLFLKNVETKEFINKLDQQLNTILNSTNMNGIAIANHSVDATAAIVEMSKKIGFTPEIQKAVKANADVLIKSMSTVKKLTPLLERLKKDPEQYIAIHSNLVAQMACSIAEAQAWSSDMTFKKITIAALLHDITINDQCIAKIQTLSELEKKKMDFVDLDIKDFPNHPIKAAEQAKSFSEIPADVDQIISQHHERPDGNGFPKKLTVNQISPLATIFIVAHDLIHELLINENFALDKFIESRKELYHMGNFKKALQILPKVQMKFP